jgi:hypothetical protein
LANDETKPNVGESPEEVATKHNKVPEAKIETRTETGTNLRCPPNRIVRFPKLDHLVSAASGHRRMSRTTMSRTAPAPHWFPLGLTTSHRRRIQRMRA